MQIQLNGKKTECSAVTLRELLQQFSVQPEMVVIEQNGAILNHTQFAGAQIHDGDSIEIIHYVGGG